MENELKKEEQLKKDAEIKAKKKKEEQLKKEAEAKLPKPKYYYDLKIECMLPATLTYRVLAENPEQAVELIKHMQPTSVRHKLIGRKDIKLMVYEAGCSVIKLIKNLGR